MIRRLLIVCTFGLFCASMAFGRGATEAWVKAYVSNTLAQATCTYSNGVNTISANGYTMTIEEPTQTGIVIKDASAAAANAGLATDKELAFDRTRWAYVAGDIVLPCTPSNITCRLSGVTYWSKNIGRQTWMVPEAKYTNTTFTAEDKLCRIVSTLLPPSIAEALIGSN